jgi:hypothetical protein
MFRRPPAEADMQRHFRVSPPSVHQMVLTIERAGFIRRHRPDHQKGFAGSNALMAGAGMQDRYVAGTELDRAAVLSAKATLAVPLATPITSWIRE